MKHSYNGRSVSAIQLKAFEIRVKMEATFSSTTGRGYWNKARALAGMLLCNPCTILISQPKFRITFPPRFTLPAHYFNLPSYFASRRTVAPESCGESRSESVFTVHRAL